MYQENPAPLFFVMTAFDSAVLIASIMLLIFAILQGFWVEKKAMVVLPSVLGAGAAAGVCMWTFMAMGSQVFGPSPYVSPILKVAVDVLSLAVTVVFLLLFALFAWEVIKAVLETFYPERKKVRVVAIASFISATVIAVVYVVAMTVVRTQSTETFVADATSPVLAVVSFAFSAALTFMRAVVWRLVVQHKAGEAKVRRNAIIFFSGSLVLAAAFLALFVVSLLDLVASSNFNTVYWVVLCESRVNSRCGVGICRHGGDSEHERSIKEKELCAIERGWREEHPAAISELLTHKTNHFILKSGPLHENNAAEQNQTVASVFHGSEGFHFFLHGWLLVFIKV